MKRLASGLGLASIAVVCILMAAAPPPAEAPVPEPTRAAVSGALAMPDAPVLDLWSQAAGVPTVFTLAVAWRETGNDTRPDRRGHAGEWGRFQIMPLTAQRRCARLNVTTTDGNLACFLKMVREDYAKTGDWRTVARIYNGRGVHADRYADGIMRSVDSLVGDALR